jgi:hypothetical protein
VRTDDQARTRLRLLYGLDEIRQDDNGTWWIGSRLRPDLLNVDTLQAGCDYLDGLPGDMLDNLTRPRGSDSER